MDVSVSEANLSHSICCRQPTHLQRLELTMVCVIGLVTITKVDVIGPTNFMMIDVIGPMVDVIGPVTMVDVIGPMVDVIAPTNNINHYS